MNSHRILPMILASLLVLSAAGASTREGEPSTPGSLQVQLDDGKVFELPLQHTDVRVEISAFVARTTIEQLFHNPFVYPIEAVYTFPLSDEAAVDDFELRSGERIIRGEIHRRREARRIYETARQEGYQAALLEQERPNIFVQSIANLMPGEQIRVRIRTVELLDYTGGLYEYLFPTVVGPRYIPGGGPGSADVPGRLDPPLLEPEERSGHDIDIHVELSAGVPIKEIYSPNQTVYVRHTSPTEVEIDLGEASRIPNRDFILRWNVASDEPALGVLTHRGDDDGFFTLLVQPKGLVGVEEAAPKELVMVLDSSGSMNGAPIEISKRFVGDALRTLGTRDRFNLIQFAGGCSTFSAQSLDNTRENVEEATRWVRNLRGQGGTEMLKGLRKAVEQEGEPGEFRQIVFLTDGYIGNEDQIIGAVAKLPRHYRVFTVGIGDSVNHYLLKRMAEVGGGAYTFITIDGDHEQALQRFRTWVTRPYLTDIEIDWGALPIGDLVPEKPRDLYSGQNLYLIGRYAGAAEGTVTLRGYLGGAYWEQEVPVSFPEKRTANEALASIWARHRIKELMLSSHDGVTDRIREQVTELALRHRLMSKFTSFVAVDYSMRVNPTAEIMSVEQPVPLPHNVTLEAVRAPVVHPAALPALLTSSPTVVERVTVSAAIDVVDFWATANSTRFSDQFISELPVPGRFYQNVLTIAPGVQSADGDGNPNVHGARTRDFKTEVSGVSNVDPLTGQLMSRISPSSIEEMEVITAGAGVEFSRAQGGFARITQKQGGNEFEGQLELGYGSHVLDGGGASADTDYDAQQGGFLLSGPIIKDRLWYRLAHEWVDREDPLDTTVGVELVPMSASVHADRLTWQVSPRNKLGFEISADRLELDNVGLSSWVGPDSTSSLRNEGPTYSLSWIAPYSPRMLFETVVAYQDRDYELQAHELDRANRCVEDGSILGHAQCLDLIANRTSGSAYRLLDQDRRRLSLNSDVTFYAGHHLGASHELTIGTSVEDERYERRLTRNPTLIRTIDDTTGEELVVARVAPDATNTASSDVLRWGVYVEDQMKPAQNVIVTVGLRVDRTELHGEGYRWTGPDGSPGETIRGDPEELRIAETAISPFLSASWDPWSNGKTKFSLSARRYLGELHPGIALIELEPFTVDLDVADTTSGELEDLVARARPNIQLLDRGLGTPYQDEWTLGFEREIFVETMLGLTYIDRSYHDQLGHVDVNQYADGASWLPPQDPRFGEVLFIGNLRSTSYRALVLEYIRRQYRNWELKGFYTYSIFEGDAHEFDLLEGDERSRIEVKQGNQSTDRRHVLRVSATSIIPWDFRLGGTVRWESGLPYSLLESALIRPDPIEGSVAIPRLNYPTARRNDHRNAPTWILDVRIAKDLNPSPDVVLQLSFEIINLLNDQDYLVYNEARSVGMRIDGVDEAMRRSGRRVQLGVRLQF
jgi:Ca-activated chloride channel family protein